jgi:hypothetical protein
MRPFSSKQLHFLVSVAKLGYGNHFLPERITYEKAALGREFALWSGVERVG